MKTNLTFKHQQPMAFLIHEVAKLMKRRFEEEARAHGITLPQWRVIAQIALNDGITQVALAAAIDTDPMTVSGVLDRLEKRGLITRYANPADSRAKLARLTEAGEAMFETTRTVGRALFETTLAGISPRDQQIAIGALTTMRANLAGDDADLEDISE